MHVTLKGLKKTHVDRFTTSTSGAEVSCSPVPYRLGGVKMGSGLMDKPCGAWVDVVA